MTDINYLLQSRQLALFRAAETSCDAMRAAHLATALAAGDRLATLTAPEYLSPIS